MRARSGNGEQLLWSGVRGQGSILAEVQGHSRVRYLALYSSERRTGFDTGSVIRCERIRVQYWFGRLGFSH